MKMACVKKQPFVLTFLLLNFFCSVVSSLYFHIGETERKCFIEEMAEDMLFVGNFKIQLDNKQYEFLPPNLDLGMMVEVRTAEDRLFLSRRYGSEGAFRFTSRLPGKYQICLQPSSSQCPLSAGGMLTVHLDTRVGERTNNYTEIAAKEKLTELQLRVYQLMEQVDQIQKENHHQRFREEQFRIVDHNTNMWIFWWPVIRSLYIVAFIIWNTGSW